MPKKTLTAMFITLFLFSAGLVFAGGMTFSGDLTGTWKQVDSWGARAGDSEHELGEGDTWTTKTKAKFHLKITEHSEDGRAFHAEWCSTNVCEDVVGAIMSDGTIYMADEDGYFTGRMIGDALELCYFEADEHFRIVTCKIMKRQ